MLERVERSDRATLNNNQHNKGSPLKFIIVLGQFEKKTATLVLKFVCVEWSGGGGIQPCQPCGRAPPAGDIGGTNPGIITTTLLTRENLQQKIYFGKYFWGHKYFLWRNISS